jgi:type IV secretory pathway VirB2 component (pilin)
MLRHIGNKKAMKIFGIFLLILGFCAVAAPFVHADLTGSEQQTQVVGDFADFMINILTGPIAKLLAAVLLISGVVALLNGKQAVAVSCAFAFLILMFIPQLLKVFTNK